MSGTLKVTTPSATTMAVSWTPAPGAQLVVQHREQGATAWETTNYAGSSVSISGCTPGSSCDVRLMAVLATATATMPATPTADNTWATKLTDPPIVDDTGNVYKLVDGSAAGRGLQISKGGVTDPVTQNVTTLGILNRKIYQENSASNWYNDTQTGKVTTTSWQQVADPTKPAPAPTPTPSGIFRVSNGEILKPDGTIFKSQGFWILSPQLSPVTSSACTPLLTWLPRINLVGISTQSSNSYDPNALIKQIDQVVTWLTAKHIVVLIGDYYNTDIGGVVDLNQAATWASVIGGHYKANPYVWIMAGPNEGSSQVCEQHRKQYDAARAAGFPNPIGFNINGTYTSGLNPPAANYATMTNIFYGYHPYNAFGDDSNTATDDAWIKQQVDNDRRLCGNSADGVVPCIASEFGNAFGSGSPVNGATLFKRVIAVSPSYGSGYIGWLAPNWYGYRQDSGNNDNLIDPATGQLSIGYGDYFAANMLAAYAPS